MRQALLIPFLLYLVSVSCGTVPDPLPCREEGVLPVWDLLDEHFGADTLFECKMYTVRRGRIDVAGATDLSRIAVVGYSSADHTPILFRAVPSAPGEDEFTATGGTLRFHESCNGRTLFVAWVSKASPAPPQRAPCPSWRYP